MRWDCGPLAVPKFDIRGLSVKVPEELKKILIPVESSSKSLRAEVSNEVQCSCIATRRLSAFPSSDGSEFASLPVIQPE